MKENHFFPGTEHKIEQNTFDPVLGVITKGN